MRFTILISMLFLIAVLGCSAGSPVDTPVAADLTSRQVSTASQVLWGLWDVTIDAETMQAGIDPIRGAAFTANVTQFMQPPMSPTNMVSFQVLPSSEPGEGYFEVDVNLRHPFPGLNQYNGFDVRGIMLSNGSVSSEHDGSLIRAGEEDTQLLNADGYTRWWNWPEFTSDGTIFGYTTGKLGPPLPPSATLNGYKYFAEGLTGEMDVAELDPSTRGFFPTTNYDTTRPYHIQFEMAGDQIVFSFQYAVCASWGDPDHGFAPDYPQEAFTLSANCQEAYAISVADAGSTAYYVDPSDNGGELVLDLEIFDWQAVENPAGVPGEISGLYIEGDVLDDAVDVLTSATVLPGSTVVSSVFEVTLGSLTLTESGTASLLCIVESQSPDTYEPQVAGGEFFDYPDAPLAAYFTFDVEISGESPGGPPTVLSIDPDHAWKDDVLTDVEVTGLDFMPGCTVELEHELGAIISGTNVTWIDEENLEVDFDFTGSPYGLFDVIVTNPGYTPGVLVEGFIVYEKPFWPSTQGNIGNTGCVGGLNGPATAQSAPDWTCENIPEFSYGNALPVYVTADSAYFTIANNTIQTPPAVAVNLDDHTIKWTRTISGTTGTSVRICGISEDGEVVIAYESSYNFSYSTIYGLDAEDGSTLWTINGVIGSDVYITHDLDGNFIVPLDGYGITSVDPDTGDENWSAPIGDPFYTTPGVGPDGTIYAMGGGQLHALDPATGTDKWGTNPSIYDVRNGITVHPNGDIIIHGMNGLYCYTDDGTSYSQHWFQNYPPPWYSSTAVGPNGHIYMVDGNEVLRELDPATGSTINSWSGVEDYAVRMAIGDDGLIYMNHNYSIRCFNADCTPHWQHTIYGGSYFSPPALGTDGTLYATKRYHGLMAWHD